MTHMTLSHIRTNHMTCGLKLMINVNKKAQKYTSGTRTKCSLDYVTAFFGDSIWPSTPCKMQYCKSF